MLTKKRLIEKLKENQHQIKPGCVSVAQDRYFVDGKVRYDLFMFKCDKQELCINVTPKKSSRWWQEGKSGLDADSVIVGAFSFETEEYEYGFDHCKFNLSELLGE